MTSQARRRWRLALGRYSEKSLGGVSGRDADADRVLDYLYAREHAKRGMSFGKGPGSLDPTQMSAINWLGKARAVFPHDVFETLQTHALDRYGLTDLLNDPKTLEALEPNPALLKVLLSFHGRAQPEVKAKLRAIADQVIKELVERLRAEIERAFSGRRDRFRRSKLASAANFDWRATIRANLATYDPERKRIIAERLYFNSRQRRRLPWRIILCVDQSGSMTGQHRPLGGDGGDPLGPAGRRREDGAVRHKHRRRLRQAHRSARDADLGAARRRHGHRPRGRLLRDIGARSGTHDTGSDHRLLRRRAAATALRRGRAPGRGTRTHDRSRRARRRRRGRYDDAVAARLADLGMHIGAMTPNRFADWLAALIR